MKFGGALMKLGWANLIRYSYILRASPRAAGPLVMRGKKRDIIAFVVIVAAAAVAAAAVVVVAVAVVVVDVVVVIVVVVSGRLWEGQPAIFYTLRAGPPTQLSLVRVSF